MRVKVTIATYENLEEKINKLGWENILQVLPDNDYQGAWVLISKAEATEHTDEEKNQTEVSAILSALKKWVIERSVENICFPLGERDFASCVIDKLEALCKQYGVEVEE